MRYLPSQIEKKWSMRWLKEGTYEPDFSRAKKPAKGEARHRRPFYNLMMFPYPSAEGLHIGGVRTFTGVDIYGRLKRMQGYDVFEPIGLDGFGINAENYALKIGTHPAKLAKITKKNFYHQLSVMGNSFAWNERLETYDPDYYRWTQWIFVRMFKHGLAYRKKSAVNWCPSCKTVLADEQVISGACERCSTTVIKKELEQWFFRITKYANSLLKNLEKIDWSENVKIAQKNWIGKSEGTLIKFKVSSLKFKIDETIEVFTTRPDTIFGATYLVLAPENKLIDGWKDKITNFSQAEEYRKKTALMAEADRIAEGKEKTGIELKGIMAINPATQQEIPVWISDYVLNYVGTGAIMAVPGHDQRDYDFATKFHLPIVIVIEPVTGIPRAYEELRKSIVAVVRNPGNGNVLSINWGQKLGGNLFIGGGIEKGEDEIKAALREIQEETGYGHVRFISKSEKIHHHYRAFSKNVNRNIEAVGLLFELVDEKRTEQKLDTTEKGKFSVEWLPPEAVAGKIKDDLHSLVYRRLVLGEVYTGSGIMIESGTFTGMNSQASKERIVEMVSGAKKIQYRLRDWLISRQRYWGPPIPMIFCEHCRNKNKGERKDMSGWYAVEEKNLPVKLPFIKNFRPTGTDQSPLAHVEKFYNVRCPKCGLSARRETDVSDTFLDSSWYYLRYPSVRDKKNPWNPNITKKWFPVDMYIGGTEHSVLHLLYARFLAHVFKDWKMTYASEPFVKFRSHGLITKDGAKMSKSKGNIVNPDEYINAYGADTMRMYLAFMAPLDQGGDFRDAGIIGITRFLNRVWNFASGHAHGVSFKKGMPHTQERNEFMCLLHKTIKKVGDDIEGLQHNTAISSLMILLNECEAKTHLVAHDDITVFLKLLAPFAPHITEELWQTLGFSASKKFVSIHREPWPSYEKKWLREEVKEFAVQINGKFCTTFVVPVGVTEQEAVRLTFLQEKVKKVLSGRTPSKTIFVPGKLVNIVV